MMGLSDEEYLNNLLSRMDIEGQMVSEITEIYIKLLGDEEGTLRPTNAKNFGNGLFEVLPIPNYESADELWQFPPGAVVRCEQRIYEGNSYLLAVEQVR